MKKTLDYAGTIRADHPLMVNRTREQIHELDQWCRLHGAPAKDITEVNLTAWTDGTGQVSLTVVERDQNGTPVKDDSGMFLKRRVIKTGLRAPLPTSARVDVR